MKKFFGVIGNPPYQEDPELGSTRSLPIYDRFMDEAFDVAEKVELVTPGRFLFNAGQTKKTWNEKMLKDEHLKVLLYEADSTKVFPPPVNVKGGIAVTYHDASRVVGPIGDFIPIDELRSIAEKSAAKTEAESLANIVESQNNYNFDNLYRDHSDYSQYISGEGRHSQLKSNALERVPIFTEEPTGKDDIRVFGLVGGERVFRYCSSAYIKQPHPNLGKYKVIVPSSNGSGAFGEALSTPVVMGPNIGYTQTFMGIGAVDTKEEAEAILKYIKTKYARAMLGILKKTQHNTKPTWIKIPLQDFTPGSDIDWTKPIADIDRQLYRKYGLTDEEVAFIESHVKEMS